MATVSPAAICRSTSARMVSVPSGLLTFFVTLSALRTGCTVFVLKWVVLAWVGLTLPLSVHAKAENPVVLVVGDSLSAGYGVAVDATWVALLQKRLAAQGYGYRVVNASISGDTTGAARARRSGGRERRRGREPGPDR